MTRWTYIIFLKPARCFKTTLIDYLYSNLNQIRMSFRKKIENICILNFKEPNCGLCSYKIVKKIETARLFEFRKRRKK